MFTSYELCFNSKNSQSYPGEITLKPQRKSQAVYTGDKKKIALEIVADRSKSNCENGHLMEVESRHRTTEERGRKISVSDQREICEPKHFDTILDLN